MGNFGKYGKRDYLSKEVFWWKTLVPIYLSGLNMQEAEQHLRREFSKIYAAISGESVHIKVTLGKIRSIMVNVMGRLKFPVLIGYLLLHQCFMLCIGPEGQSNW